MERLRQSCAEAKSAEEILKIVKERQLEEYVKRILKCWSKPRTTVNAREIGVLQVKDVAQLFSLGHCNETTIIDLIHGIGALCGTLQLGHIFALYVLFEHSGKTVPRTVRPSDVFTAAATRLVHELDIRSRELAKGWRSDCMTRFMTVVEIARRGVIRWFELE